MKLIPKKLKQLVVSFFLVVGICAFFLPGREPSAEAKGSLQPVFQTSTNPTNAPTDQIIISFRTSSQAFRTPAGADQLTRLRQAAGVSLQYYRSMSGNAHVFKLPTWLPMNQVQKIADLLAALTDVAYAEPDQIFLPTLIPNDTYYSTYQWDLFESAGGINVQSAWDITTGSSSVVVAITDTGLTNHLDLAGRMVSGSLTTSGYDFISNTLIANDGNVRDSDPSDPGDWVSQNDINSNPGTFSGCSIDDSSWHGTHVAGTIGAASDNSQGVAGINWNSKLLIVRVLGKCGGFLSDITDGMRWAAGLSVSGVPANANPAKVINVSLGGSGACGSTYQNAINAINNAGVVVVAAAGNSNVDVSGFRPANCAGVIAVAATGRTGSKASYSNFGALVKISAPGGNGSDGIISTINAGITTPTSDTYAEYLGTSMATPHVVGVVSLMFSVNPSLSPSQVLQILQGTARPFPGGSTCNTSICGSGIVDAGAAVSAAQPSAPFSKTSPVNGATGQPVSLSLNWGTSTRATSYSYCIDNVNNNSCDGSWINVGNTTNASISGLVPSMTYYWHVRASNGWVDGYADTNTWSSFSTLGPYTLTVTKTGNGSGTVTSDPTGINCGATCSADYSQNTSVTLSASANAGSTFTGWSGSCSGTGNCTVTMDTAKSVSADFTLSCFTLTTGVNPAGSGSVGVDQSPNCAGGKYTYGTVVNLTPSPASDYYRFNSWSGDASGSSVPQPITISTDRTVTANFDQSTFTDVAFNYSETLGGVDYLLYPYIQALFNGGYTAGCGTDPLRYCPANNFTRAESAVFMLRGNYGGSYGTAANPLPAAAGTLFADMTDVNFWGTAWAESMYNAGLTAGCATNPLMFCPNNQLIRIEASVFALRLKFGVAYGTPANPLPPALTPPIFADTDMPAWGQAWAEQAYLNGILPACGIDIGSGKPFFCPNALVDRAWAAYMVVKGKSLTLP